MSILKLQFRAIFKKNWLIYWRSGGVWRDLVNILIMFAVVIALTYSGSSASQVIPVFMTLAILMFCRSVSMSWNGQKQSKQAQLQKIMGATRSAYFAGWFFYFLLNGIAVSVLFTVLLNATNIYSNYDISFGTMLGIYLLFMLMSFSFVLFLSSFFADAMLGAQLITFIQIIMSFLYFLLLINGYRTSTVAIGITSIFPPLCFQFTFATLGFGSQSQAPIAFTTNQGIITMACLSIGYFILFIYFQLVLPNQTGSNLDPLFFLKCCFKSKQPRLQIQESFELTNISSARYYQPAKDKKRISLHVKDMVKKFEEKTVVNNLSLSLFEKQVFCLLGHNGAGKSTIINILTGIMKPDKGAINILGYDYFSQMATIRANTGACLQIDVLYEQLTVRQHIEYYAQLKGFSGASLTCTVDSIMTKIGIQSQGGKRTNNLSGGNKRKTCLACAAVGGSSLLFLDQPSSGLDPNSRRFIWSLIKDLKAEGRTIVLTTHHLQEAEALADRIGILAHGQLLVLGSSLYIKEKFSCGYHLQISLNNEQSYSQQKSTARQAVKQLVTNAIEDDQVSNDTMKFMLPFTQQQNYSQLFQILQSKNFRFNLGLSSLQDIFVKIGVDVDSVLNNEHLPDLQKIQIPNYEPHYNFCAQFRAVFYNKGRTTLRSFSVFISIFLPLIFIVMGIAVAMQVFGTATGQQQLIYNWSRYNLISFCMCLAFSFNTASYCGSIVRQRQIHWKYLSYVQGLSKAAYWTATIVFDLIMFCLPLAFVFLVIGVFPAQQNAQFVAAFGWLALTFILFALSFLSFTYLWSFAFQKSKTAYRLYPFLMFLVFYIVPSLPIYLAPTSSVLQWVLPIVSPLMALNDCILSRQMFGETAYYSLINNGYDLNLYSVQDIGYPLGIMGVQMIVFFAIALAIDNAKFSLRDRQEIDSQEAELKQSEDLLREKQKIKSLESVKPIVVNDLYKKYPNGLVAIKDNSFVIQKGQTFGLLGPNGAGKSTTFSVLTAAVPKTRGTVQMHGNQVNRSVSEIFTTVGICPQFNPLYDTLTVQQHIQFFAGVKGLNGKQKQHLIDFYIEHMQLSEYRKVRSAKLSGGNKRKLCVTMALIGNPSLVFLDEPSAGVDPIARRYLWNVLHSANSEKERSIVLTTHSINQAESLCDRIGILIKGEFYCIDSPRELKKRYGKGYRAVLRCSSLDNLRRADEQVSKSFHNYKRNVFEQELKISYEFEKSTFVFSQAFKLFFNVLKKGGVVEEFELVQTTLEQVFIFLSKLQGQEKVIKFQQVSSCCCCERTSQGCFCLC